MGADDRRLRRGAAGDGRRRRRTATRDAATRPAARAAPDTETGSAPRSRGMTIALTDRPDNAPMEPRIAIGLEEATRACERLGGAGDRARVAVDFRLGRPQHHPAHRGLVLSPPSHSAARAVSPCDRRVLWKRRATLRRAPPLPRRAAAAAPRAPPRGSGGFATTGSTSCSSPRFRSSPTSAGRAMTAATPAGPATR